MYSEKKGLHARQRAHTEGNLRTIAVDVTNKCNMNCAHCYAEPFSKVEPVPEEHLAPFFDEAYDLGVFHYVLQGGEAITDMDRLERIIGMTRPEESYLNLVSNGWEMTRDIVRLLRTLNVDKITMSLDSGIPEDHDVNRRPGSFERVVQAVEDILAEGLLAGISTVVTRRSLYEEGFKRVLAYCDSKRIRLDVQIAMPVGKLEGCKDLLMRPQDSQHILDLRNSYPPLANGQDFIKRDVYCGGDTTKCPAGRDFMSITADGHILPCNFCQYSLGRIPDTTLGKARRSIMQSRWFQGEHPLCLLGEDEEFYSLYAEPHVGAPKPLDAYSVFDLRRD